MKKQRNPIAQARELETARRLIERAEALTDDAVLRSTVPIYRTDDYGRLELFGSGVLLGIDGIRFLVTAGHVFDHVKEGPIGAGMAAGLLTVTGLPIRLRSIGSKTPDEDRIDIGAVRLQGDEWTAIEPSQFLSLSRVDAVAPIAARHTYALIGFPVSINRRGVVGDRVTGGAYRCAGLESERDAYSDVGVDPANHVMVGFDKRSMLDVRGARNAPDLNGTSGAGLWRFGRRVGTSNAQPRLSAIMTECHTKGKHKYMLGTRIQVVLEGLADKYPDVAKALVAHEVNP